MTPVPTKFLIDGIDRLGKSSLIQKIQEHFGYHLVIHYDKPKFLPVYSFYDYHDPDKRLLALKTYQRECNFEMFNLLKTDARLILDRTHLGEMVYAPLYRKYSGEYVYDMERELIESKPYTYKDDIRLILLTSSNTEMLKDDGLSFDPTKKDEEQKMFIEAFNRSALTNKIIVDVHNGNGGYKSYDQVFDEAINK